MRDELDWVRAHVAAAHEARERLGDALRAMGIRVPAIEANFVFVPVRRRGRSRGANARALGVPCGRSHGLDGIGDGVRITVGPWP